VTEPILTFRDMLLQKVPPWLRRGTAQKILVSIGQHVDAYADAVVAGVKLRFPGFYTDESLPLIGRERRIRRGPNESAATYATRLLRWLDDHRHRGNPYTMLAQLFAYYAPNSFAITMVYRSGRYFAMDANGVVTRGDFDTSTWDDLPEQWARWWLFYDWPDDVGSDGVWDDPGVWDDDGLWDSDLTVADAYDLRLVPTEWNAARSLGTVVLLSGDIELWDFPIGTWDDPGVWEDRAPATFAVR
jgi:hypothetical protein